MSDVTPRCLTRLEAAAYCGCKTLASFDRWVRIGKLPGAMPGTRRWDRKALDEAIDRMSGIGESAPNKPSALAQFRERRDAKKAAAGR